MSSSFPEWLYHFHNSLTCFQLPTLAEKVVEKPKGGTAKKPAPPPPPPSPPYCPTPDYDTVSLASEVGKQKGDIVEMQSLESFKLTNPSHAKPKPPSTYFPKGSEMNGLVL